MTQRIAVVGGGVAGIASAHLLSRQNEVTLFEAGSYLGGHTNTITIPDGPDAGLGVDTGFIVCNDTTYPNFHRFIASLGVRARFSDMSFSFACQRSGLEYGSSGFNGLFAQRRNLVSPQFWGMLLEIQRFWKEGSQALSQSGIENLSFGDWLKQHHFSGPVVEDYLIPISAAIWSSSAQELLDFPLTTFLHFYRNHGLLKYFKQPRWQTVEGGSHAYVKAFQKQFPGVIHLATPVRAIQRHQDGVTITSTRGAEQFDQLVLATHADISLKLLSDPDEFEHQALSPWRYNRNHTVLHTDISVLPRTRRAWASWNYRRELAEQGTEPVSVTYYMNNLQGFNASQHYLVTLNPRTPIASRSIIREIEYHHPAFTVPAVNGRNQLVARNGSRRTWYAGSYFGFGFHEDAVTSAVKVAQGLGVSETDQ